MFLSFDYLESSCFTCNMVYCSCVFMYNTSLAGLFFHKVKGLECQYFYPFVATVSSNICNSHVDLCADNHEIKDQRNTKLLNVTLWTSLFMFHLVSFSPHFIVHVSSHFLHSTLHWSCFIFISFIPQSISFISPTTVHVVHLYLIWLYSYDMVIQPHCQFHFSTNPDSEN